MSSKTAVLACLIAIASACSESSQTPSDGGADASFDAPVDQPTQCVLSTIGPTACRSCLEAKCCDPTTKCLADSVCTRMLLCEETYAKAVASGVDAGPPPNCAATEPAHAVILIWNPFGTCRYDNCVTECDYSVMTH